MKIHCHFLPFALFIFLIAACDKGRPAQTSEVEAVEEQSYSKGIGAFKDLQLSDPLVPELVSSGRRLYNMKCVGCHTLNEERDVGPGWAGITNRRSPEWIMNMITNTNVMLEKDEEARKLLDECMTHMPDQDVSVNEARSILEYMRKNDVEQMGSKDQGAN